MRQETVLRLAFIVGDGNSTSFQKNLGKLIDTILYDSGNQSLSCYDITKLLENDYELIFTQEEIARIVEDSSNVLVYLQNFESGVKKFQLSARNFNNLKNRDDKYDFSIIIKKYIMEFSIKSDEQYLKNKIAEFLYNSFNSNKSALLNLINKSYSGIIENSEWENVDKKLVNDFLNWENEDKDIYIFNTISYCVDYCMLTAKKDVSSLSHIFGGKKFYLDTNVIFRMAGLNNQERQTVISSFIEKCVESKIELLYTNFTYQEIDKTIKSIVQKIESINNGNKPIDFKHYEYFQPTSDYIDILRIYNEWFQEKSNNYQNYQEFRKYLMNRINSILGKFRKVEFTDYYFLDKIKFNSFVGGLENYKNDHGALTNQNSLSIDINNFMYIHDLRKKEKGNNLFDLNIYFISTDSKLCDWCKLIIPGSIPIFVMPSVWYSLILKFRGRTNEDFRAFNYFLNMRYRTESNKETIAKFEILKTVQSLDDSQDIKNKILQSIHDDLTLDYSRVQVVNHVEKVENSVVEKEIERFRSVEGQNLIDKGRYITLSQIADTKINDLKRNLQLISKTINILKITLTLPFLFFLIYLVLSSKFMTFLKMFNNAELGYNATAWITLLLSIFGMISWGLDKPIKNLILDINSEKQKDRVIKRLIKKYPV